GFITENLSVSKESDRAQSGLARGQFQARTGSTSVTDQASQGYGAAVTRTLFAGGTVFDGTGAAPAPGDVLVEAGRILDVGTGLDGDELVDGTGLAVLPGLFDWHVPATVSSLSLLEAAPRPFSLQFFEAARNLERTLAAGITTIRDAAGADLGIQTAVANGLVRGPRMRIAISIISQTGGHGDDWLPSGCTLPVMGAHPGRPSG